MEQNNIIAAPAVRGVGALYRQWLTTHAGSVMSFYRFMTRPSAGRDAFVHARRVSESFVADILVTQVEP